MNPRDLGDSLFEASEQRFVVGNRARRREFEIPAQRGIPLGEAHDHLDEFAGVSREKIRADLATPVEGLGKRLRAEIVCGERARHQVLAEAPIVEGRAGAVPGDVTSGAQEFRAIDLGAEHPRHDAGGIDRDDIDPLVLMVGDAARVHLLTRDAA